MKNEKFCPIIKGNCTNNCAFLTTDSICKLTVAAAALIDIADTLDDLYNPVSEIAKNV